MKSWPSISVVIATYNSGQVLDKCLRLVREQDYPQSKVEIICADGGSKDNTFEIAKKYKAKIINIPPEKQHAEYNRGVGFNVAKGELVLILDHDNFLPYKKWLQDMIIPLLENPKMVATSTARYHYSKRYDLLDRYFALFGTSEPLPYYLHKADRASYLNAEWNLSGKVENRGKYYLVRFSDNPREFPSIGTNGCMMRKSVLEKHADVRPDHHYPIDVMVDVIKKGHREFGIVKNTIIHLTNSKGFWDFIKRRKKFVEQYHFNEHDRRRWSVFMPGDEMRLALYVLYSITIIKPLYDSFRGYLKVRDVAWFIHPVMCLMTTMIYGYVVLKHKFF